MNNPIAVFDAGLGSYAIVEAIKKAYPQQEVSLTVQKQLKN